MHGILTFYYVQNTDLVSKAFNYYSIIVLIANWLTDSNLLLLFVQHMELMGDSSRVLGGMTGS